MRALVFVLLVFGLAVPAAVPATGATSLRITIWDTPSATPHVLILHCTPPDGTVPQPRAACSRLERLGRAAFAPTPPGTACSMIYGGPQRAVVTGTMDGQRIWASFRRRNGCEIARWNRIVFLLGQPAQP